MATRHVTRVLTTYCCNTYRLMCRVVDELSVLSDILLEDGVRCVISFALLLATSLTRAALSISYNVLFLLVSDYGSADQFKWLISQQQFHLSLRSL